MTNRQRVMVAVAGAAALAWPGCSRSARRKGPDPTPRPTASPAPVLQPMLLLEAHLPEQASARYQAVRVEPDGSVALGEALEAPALPMQNWPGHFRTAVAFDHGLWARAEQTSAPDAKPAVHRVVVRRLGGGAGADVAIDAGAAQPAALHLAAGGLFVGSAGRVAWSDLGRPAAPTTLVERDMAYKEYDLFVRDGDRVLAIDDVVTPMLADWFRVGAGRAPERLGDFTMPGLINGHYDLAALVPGPGPDEWRVYVVAPYGIMSGWGQELAVLPIRKDKLDVPERMLLNGGGGPGVEEHVDRGTHKPERLTTGTEFTAFTGLAVAPDGHVLVAAGERGVLVFAASLAGAPTVLPGVCHDVIVFEGRLFALCEEPAAPAGGIPVGAATAAGAVDAGLRAGVLLGLKMQGEGVVEVSRTRLPTLYRRFVN